MSSACCPDDAQILSLDAGIVMSMFLSLTAMQFLFSFPASQYLNALQQVRGCGDACV